MPSAMFIITPPTTGSQRFWVLMYRWTLHHHPANRLLGRPFAPRAQHAGERRPEDRAAREQPEGIDVSDALRKPKQPGGSSHQKGGKEDEPSLRRFH